VKYFLDTEFIEDGVTIDLISIGMVSEDGRELYLGNAECQFLMASPWVVENVYPHVPTPFTDDVTRIREKDKCPDFQLEKRPSESNSLP